MGGLTHHTLHGLPAWYLNMFATCNIQVKGSLIVIPAGKGHVPFQFLTVSCIPAIGYVCNISRYRT